MTKVCDYHDLPLVCGECSYFDGFPTQTPEKHDAYWRIQGKFHPFRPVHRIPDPEFDTVDIVPCGLA